MTKMDIKLFNQLPYDVKNTIKEMCIEEVYYIYEINSHSFEDIYKCFHNVINNDSMQNMDHQYNLLKMFQHIVQHLDYFDKERCNTLTKGINSNGETIMLPWKNRFDEQYWYNTEYFNDYCVNQNGDWVINKNIRKGLCKCNVDCIRLKQDFINTLNLFDDWFQENYNGTTSHTKLLKEINKIYKYVFTHYVDNNLIMDY